MNKRLRKKLLKKDMVKYDMMDFDNFSKLSKNQIKAINLRLEKEARRRQKEIRKANLKSYALKQLSKQYINESSIQAQRHNIVALNNFLKSRTSTVKGIKENLSEIHENLLKIGLDVPVENIDRFFDIYEKLRQLNPKVHEQSLKYNVFEEINKVLAVPKSEDELAVKLSKEVKNIYEKKEEEYNKQNVSPSKFFRKR